MRKYHEDAREKEKISAEKNRLDSLISKKMWELEMLEEGWYLLRRELETKQILLEEREKLIDMKVGEFQELMRKAKESEKVKESEKADMPADKFFVLADGEKISSLGGLKQALKTMDEHIFMHHVNEKRNDFSRWIRHVFGDAQLADKMLSAKTRDGMIRTLEENTGA